MHSEEGCTKLAAAQLARWHACLVAHRYSWTGSADWQRCKSDCGDCAQDNGEDVNHHHFSNNIQHANITPNTNVVRHIARLHIPFHCRIARLVRPAAHNACSANVSSCARSPQSVTHNILRSPAGHPAAGRLSEPDRQFVQPRPLRCVPGARRHTTTCTRRPSAPSCKRAPRACQLPAVLRSVSMLKQGALAHGSQCE